MSAESPTGPGLGDLEKELTCSICTELLYQPLTLLDCLHTYCGSCLKEWFLAQASRRHSSSVRYTCPACRAIVRETRPNATVTTLLDMVLAANPERNKSAAEKEEIAQRYKHGDSVFPSPSSPPSSTRGSDEEDRRLIEEVREMSLQDTGARSRRRPSRTRRAESVDGADRRSRRREERQQAPRSGAQPTDASERTRRVEHQSSLRSLLSLSDTETMEEEILRQILEEGLLDDIDLDNLGPAQEEELSERIADAYRRRHRMRSRSQQRRETQDSSTASSTPARPRARSQSVQRRQPPAVQSSREDSRNPPVSRPYLLDPLMPRSGQSGHQRRLSDQGSSRRRTSPVPVHPASTSDMALRPAARSSSDMASDRPRQSGASRVQISGSRAPRARRATESEPVVPNISIEREVLQRTGRPSVDSPTIVASPVQGGQNGSFSSRSEQAVSSPTGASSLAAEVGNSNGQGRSSRPSSSRSAAAQSSATYPEPSVSCDRCGKQNIQYELHKKCGQCNGGNYHICLRCYRLGAGCLSWAGFGPSANTLYEQARAFANGQPSQPRETQHVLLYAKYSRPVETAYRIRRSGRDMTNDDPSRRLQKGLFCDICQSQANDCFWKCDQCNEGDWGFCNRCVNQGKCCTHSLLPICRLAANRSNESPTGTDNTSNGPSVDVRSETVKILSFSTRCDICTHPISASTQRFHCLQCNNGDYDICANCYLKLVATSKIHKENGHHGWRRCLKGHRMVVVGFEDHEDGQRRIIVRDLVGGRALQDEHVQPSTPSSTASPATSSSSGRGAVASPEVGKGDWSWKEGSERRKKASRLRNPASADSEPSTPVATIFPSASRRYPPDGGVGLLVHAMWSYYPENEVTDELMFPRGAEITEAENINDDWYWGCYAGCTGLFPGGHGRVVGEIT